MVVQHNLRAMNSNRMLGLTASVQSKSTEKLSSGYKINRAADDAAGLSISEKMRKQIRGLSQASLNAADGISAVQTAEGALNEVQDMLQRMNELAVKAANGTMSEDDRNYIQDEIDQLVTEIDRVAETTKFNETYLLKGVSATETVETEATASVTYDKSITGKEKIIFTATADTFYATKDGESVAIDVNNFNKYVTLDTKTVVDSVKIGANVNLYSEDGTTPLSGAQLKAELNKGGKVYTSAAQTGADKGTVGGDTKDYTVTDATFSNYKAAAGTAGTATDVAVDNTVATGNYTFTNGQWEDVTTGAVVTGITTTSTFVEGDTISVTGASVSITDKLYVEGGVDQLTPEQALAAINNGEKLFTNAYVAREEAELGVDYFTETHEESFVTAKDGYEIYKNQVPANTPYGDQKTPATEAQLKEIFKIETDLLYSKDAKGNYYSVSADDLSNYFDEFGTYSGKLFKDNAGAMTEIGAEQIDNFVDWTRTEAKTEEVVVEKALNFSLQVGADANENNKISIDIESMSAKSLGVDGLKVDGKDSANADAAVDVIAEAIQKVSTQRSALGAVQNRLEHTIANLDNVVENTTAAESQIRDTDMATEMVKFSNNNILAQAGQAMLAQANQANQGVLSLLG